MSLSSMSFLVVAGSFVAGFLGSLTGLGGGVVVVPLLAIVFGVDLRYAVGASLLSVIATSSGAAAAYVRDGISNLRVGMFLEIATTLGALGGAAIATHVAKGAIAIVFGIVLIGAAVASLRRPADLPVTGPGDDPLSRALRLDGSYPTPTGRVDYRVRHIPAGFGLMAIAGALSGLLGIGSGALKVIAMDDVMRLPFKVSSTTSNFMIGVTAAASAGPYLAHGYIAPAVAAPVVLGVLPGALLGARLLPRLRSRSLRLLFAAVIAVLAVEMLYQGATGRL
jgi:uncharacterized membrane protein YfcA